jgi:hypothetical protein
VAALRAGSLAFLLSLIGTAVIAAAVLSPRSGPTTIAEAIDAPSSADLDTRRALAVAALTHACMQALGLPYDAVPEPPASIPDAHLDPITWAERWGFGIATAVGAPALAPVEDPNATRLAGLPGPARARYLQALYGDGAGQIGCHGSAVDQVHGLRDRALAPVRSRFEELEGAVAADPATAPVTAAWDGCVRRLGIAATDRATLVERMRQSFTERVAAIAQDPRLVAAVAAEERRIAAGIARCEAEHAERMAVVAAPHEQRFVARYGSLLARIGARIRAAEATYPVSRPTLVARRPGAAAR